MTIALITGGASGIGRATADILAADGAHVLICDRAGAVKAAAEIASKGGKADGLDLDISDVTAVKRAAANLLQKHGVIDAIVACAGISGHGSSFAEVDEAAFDAMMNVHLRGHFFLVQALAPAMQKAKRGTIVFVSSIYARIGIPSMPHYAAAKGALIGLTKALATQLGPDGIRVNAVTPGLIRTPMTEKSAERNPTLFEARADHVPLRRLTTPVEVAETIVWLLSPGASSMTGQALSPSSGEVMAD